MDEWVQAHLDVSHQTAARLMQIAKATDGPDQSQGQLLADALTDVCIDSLTDGRLTERSCHLLRQQLHQLGFIVDPNSPPLRRRLLGWRPTTGPPLKLAALAS